MAVSQGATLVAFGRDMKPELLHSGKLISISHHTRRSAPLFGAAASMKPVPRPLNRTLRSLGGTTRFYFIRRDATVAVSVEPQDECARLIDELLARDLAVLILVKITEIRVCQRQVGLANRFELGRVKLSVVVAIRRGKYPVGIFLPF